MTTLTEYIAQREARPRFATRHFVGDHCCDYGNCSADAVLLATTAFVHEDGRPTSIVEVRGVCERHATRIPNTITV